MIIAVGELVLELRGCLEFLENISFENNDVKYIRQCIKRGKFLLKEHERRFSNPNNLTEYSWLSDSVPDYYLLKERIRILENSFQKGFHLKIIK